MTKQLFANEKVMKQYLDALLQEESSETLVSPVENLLSDVESKAAEHQKAIFEPVFASHRNKITLSNSRILSRK